MPSDPVLSVRSLSKAYTPVHQSRWAALAMLMGLRSQRSALGKPVLRDISFDLWPGQALAIIGRNGSGKSTLLKLINGSLVPDTGSIICRGRISAILELGAGFDLAATGRQNMAMQAALWGVSARRLAEQAQAIIDFSELGSAIDEPVRTYSSGMMLRLAFSIAIHAQAELLIVDEALAVGDARFQQKCMGAIRAHLARGGSLLFVSHDFNSVKTLCSEAILLEQGHIIRQGRPTEVCDAYLERLLSPATASGTVASVDAPAGDDKPARLVALLVNGRTQREATLRSGDWLEVTIQLQAQRPVGNLAVGVMLHDVRGQDLFGTNTHLAQAPIDLDQPGQTCLVTLRIQLLLGGGHYTLTVGVHDADDYTRNVIYWGFGAIALDIVDPDPRSVGHCRLPHTIQVDRMQATPQPTLNP